LSISGYCSLELLYFHGRTKIRSRTPEAAAMDAKLANDANVSPIDCARLRHTNVVGLEFAKFSSSGEHIYPPVEA
jgi:hypothetical protein